MIALIVVGRTEIYQDDLLSASLDGRYRLYGMLFTAVLAISLVRSLESAGFSTARLQVAVVAIALVVNVHTYVYKSAQLERWAENWVAAMRSYVQEGDDSRLSTWALPRDQATRQLDQAIVAGRYRPPMQTDGNVEHVQRSL
jgi:hypothetical protein